MSLDEPVCNLCGLLFSSHYNLSKHENKKKACNVGKYHCGKCDQRFDDNSNCHKHRKKCRGRHVRRQELLTKCEEMEHKLREFEASISPNTNEDQEEHEDECQDDTDDSAQIIEADPTHTICILMLKTIVCVEPVTPQMYFFEAGPALVPVKTCQTGIVIKFGWTDTPYTRTMTHKRDFGGGRVLDSIICKDPKGLESKFKKYMKMTDRLIRAKVERKPCVDTEVFIVKNQEEYAEYIAKAVEMAASFGEHTDMLEQMRQYFDNFKNEIAAASSTPSSMN